MHSEASDRKHNATVINMEGTQVLLLKCSKLLRIIVFLYKSESTVTKKHFSASISNMTFPCWSSVRSRLPCKRM